MGPSHAWKLFQRQPLESDKGSVQVTPWGLALADPQLDSREGPGKSSRRRTTGLGESSWPPPLSSLPLPAWPWPFPPSFCSPWAPRDRCGLLVLSESCGGCLSPVSMAQGTIQNPLSAPKRLTPPWAARSFVLLSWGNHLYVDVGTCPSSRWFCFILNNRSRQLERGRERKSQAIPGQQPCRAALHPEVSHRLARFQSHLRTRLGQAPTPHHLALHCFRIWGGGFPWADKMSHSFLTRNVGCGGLLWVPVHWG